MNEPKERFRTTIYLYKDIHLKLRQIALKRATSMSEIIREIADKIIKEDEGDPKP